MSLHIVHSPLLGGWFVVRGAHRTPISGRFGSRSEAQDWLNRRNSRTLLRETDPDT